MSAPSPASSLQTEYHPDATTSDDRALDDDAFARKVTDAIGINRPRDDAPDVLLPLPKSLHEQQGALFCPLISLPAR